MYCASFRCRYSLLADVAWGMESMLWSRRCGFCDCNTQRCLHWQEMVVVVVAVVVVVVVVRLSAQKRMSRTRLAEWRHHQY